MILKNISQSEIIQLKNLVDYREGQVVSKTLVQSRHVGITIFNFWKGEFISTHQSDGDAFVLCLDGTGKVEIDGQPYVLHQGDAIVMPANHPHAVYGEDNFKMMLTVVFPQD